MVNKILARWMLVGFGLCYSFLLTQVFGIPITGEYVVESRSPVLTNTADDSNQLYLRHAFYLNELPDNAWLQILGRDWLELYVNGSKIGRSQSAGYTTAILVDITERLRVGKNQLAIVTHRTGPKSRPGVIVEGGYQLGGVEYPLNSDSGWLHTSFFEQTHTYWFSEDFDDSHWQPARQENGQLRAVVSFPPRAYSNSSEGSWIMADTDANGRAAVRKQISISSRPSQAWLELTALAPYRLAVNGILVEPEVIEPRNHVSEKHTINVYDLVPLLRRGTNTVALTLNAQTGGALIKPQGEIFYSEGRRSPIDAGSFWLCQAAIPPDWYKTTIDREEDWLPCHTQSWVLHESDRKIRSEFKSTSPSFSVLMRSLLVFLVLALLIGLLTSILVDWFYRRISHQNPDTRLPLGVLYLPLLLVILVTCLLELLTWDPRIARSDIFTYPVFMGLTASVPLQWFIFFKYRPFKRARFRTPRRFALTNRIIYVTLLLSIAAGTWLRIAEIAEDPLRPDEITVYRSTMGTLERGFPSIKVHENIPVGYKATSELTYLPTALVALFTDQDYLVVRLPGLIFSIFTIPLLFLAGTRIFGREVGMVAACIYALSSISIELSVFGRYPSQLQFFTLLSVYGLFRTVEKPGHVDRRWLWLTALFFSAMYLSWEGSILLVPGMVLSVFALQRGNILAVMRESRVWLAMFGVGLLLLLQHAHRTLEQSGRLAIGSGTSEVSVKLMSLFPGFDPQYYILASSWTESSLIPILGLLFASILAFRHGSQRQLQFLLANYLTTALVLVLLLPVRASRYGYQLMPLLILLDAFLLIVIARFLSAVIIDSWQVGPPTWWRNYARGLSIAFVGIVLVLSTNTTVRTDELTWFRGGARIAPAADFPAATEFLRSNMRDGDVLLATIPHAVEHYLERPVDYWPQSRLHLQATLDDEEAVFRHRLIGTEMISNIETLRRLFSENKRIWFVVVPLMHDKTNQDAISIFLRSKMKVVHESNNVLVMFHGDGVDAPSVVKRKESILQRAKANYLP